MIVYRICISKQKAFATNDQSEDESMNSPAFRRKNGKFSKKNVFEKSIRSQESVMQARATKRSQFECPTNIAWTRTQEVYYNYCNCKKKHYLYILHMLNYNIHKVLYCILIYTR